MIFRSILRLIFNSFSKFWFLTIPWPFLGIFGRFSGIFCVWMGYRSHIFYLWSLELYQEISYEIFIFDHIWGEGAGIGKLATGDFCARSGPPQLGVVLVLFRFKRLYQRVAFHDRTGMEREVTVRTSFTRGFGITRHTELCWSLCIFIKKHVIPLFICRANKKYAWDDFENLDRWRRYVGKFSIDSLSLSLRVTCRVLHRKRYAHANSTVVIVYGITQFHCLCPRDPTLAK